MSLFIIQISFCRKSLSYVETRSLTIQNPNVTGLITTQLVSGPVHEARCQLDAISVFRSFQQGKATNSLRWSVQVSQKAPRRRTHQIHHPHQSSLPTQKLQQLLCLRVLQLVDYTLAGLKSVHAELRLPVQKHAISEFIDGRQGLADKDKVKEVGVVPDVRQDVDRALRLQLARIVHPDCLRLFNLPLNLYRTYPSLPQTVLYRQDVNYTSITLLQEFILTAVEKSQLPYEVHSSKTTKHSIANIIQKILDTEEPLMGIRSIIVVSSFN